MLLIGSQAVRFDNRFFGLFREPKDYDFICTLQEYGKLIKAFEGKIEAKKYDGAANKIYIKLYSQEILELELIHSADCSALMLSKLEDRKNVQMLSIAGVELKVSVASLEALLFTKLSHRYKKDSPHFLKTMSDIICLRESLSGTTYYEEKLKGYYAYQKKREEETYSYKHPKLNQSKKSFFEDEGILFEYVHDDLHEAVKLMDKPAYTYFQEEGEEVKSSKEKFFNCSEEIRLNAVLEETYVLALERSQIPFTFWPNRFKSFEHALEKVCTSITSGWFREYAWEHYHEALYSYSPEYVDKFHRALKAGQIRKANK